MATHPDRDRAARCDRRVGRARREAFLAALALSLLGASTRGQTSAGAELSAAEIEALDVAELSGDEARELAVRLLTRDDKALPALRLLERKIDELEEAGTDDLGTLASLHFHLADAQRVQRRFEAALASLRESEELLDLFVDSLAEGTPAHAPRLGWARTLRSGFTGLRGWIHQDWGALEAAAKAFDEEQAEIAEFARSGVDPATVARARVNADRHLANFAMLTGTPGRIEERLAAREVPPRSDVERAYLRLRWAGAVRERARREGTGQAEARVALEIALAEPGMDPSDRVLGELWLADLELDEARSARARELWAAATARMDALGASGPRAHRRRVSVGARLAEAPAELAHWRSVVAAEVETFLEDWSALEAVEGGYGLLHLDDTQTLFAEHVRLLLALEGEELGARHALETLARVHAETYLARRLTARAPTLEELRQALCPSAGQGLLVYQTSPPRSWVFLLDAQALDVVALPGHFQLDGPRRILVQEILAHGGQWTDAARTAAADLALLLLPPEVRARVETWDSLAVTGLDHLLGDVPFELLELGPERRMGTEKAVWHLPSLAAGVELARRRSPTAEPAVRLVAAPTMAATLAAELALDPFALAPDQVERLLAPFATGQRAVRIGPEASAGALLGAEPVLLILSHGVFEEARARSAQLVLAPGNGSPDGLFSFADVERTWSARPAPPVVLLSACRAGRGVMRRGDAGAASLGTAFLAHGSLAVLASPYDLDLGIATELGAEFHAGLARGLDPAEALRRARLRLAHDDGLADSLQPHLVRAIGFASPPFEPWIDEERGSASSALPWILGGAGLGLLLVRWRRRRQ